MQNNSDAAKIAIGNAWHLLPFMQRNEE